MYGLRIRSALTGTVLSIAGALLAAASMMGPLPARAQTTLPPVVVESASRAVSPPPRSAPLPAPPRRSGSASPGSASATQPGTSPVASPGASEAEGENAASAVVAAPGTLLVNQGTAATVVTSEQLRDQQVRSPVEALRGLPGVTVGRTGGFGGFSQVRIRGAEGNQTLVLVDGVEINNPADGEFDFSNLVGGEEIERIEVLRGPQSGLYGSGAIGGVVNIVTKSGRGPLTLTTRAEAGSFNTRDAAAVLSGGNDRAWGLAGIQQRRTDGFNVARLGTERDGSQTTSSIIKGGFRPFEALTIEGLLRHTGKRGDRDEENFFVPGVLIEQIDARSRFSSDLWVGALEAKLSLFDGAWVQSFRGERRAITNDDLSVNPAFAPFEGYERYRSNAEVWRYTSTFRLDTPGMPQVRHFLTGLAERRNEGFVQYTNDGIDHERRMQSFAGEVRGEYWNSLFLSGSVRRDDSDAFGDFTTWRASASLRLPGSPVRLHASAGTGVKLPTLFEQFGRVPLFFTPNPDLRAETATGWDAGVELTLAGGALVLDATRFETELKDKIRGANGGTTVVNLPGISTREGVELSGKLRPLPGLTIGASYTWLEAREPTGTAEIRRPRNSGRADITYAFDRDRAKIGLAALYNGSVIDEALRSADPFIFPLTPERVVLKDYWLLSAMASYKVTPTLEIFGRAENLLDQRYQEVYGFQTPGLAVFGGVRVTLQDRSTAPSAAR
jgi:vitamin B12 transporter